VKARFSEERPGAEKPGSKSQMARPCDGRRERGTERSSERPAAPISLVASVECSATPLLRANYIDNLVSQKYGRFIVPWEADLLKPLFYGYPVAARSCRRQSGAARPRRLPDHLGNRNGDELD
jgi:hypothetical protein